MGTNICLQSQSLSFTWPEKLQHKGAVSPISDAFDAWCPPPGPTNKQGFCPLSVHTDLVTIIIILVLITSQLDLLGCYFSVHTLDQWKEGWSSLPARSSQCKAHFTLSCDLHKRALRALQRRRGGDHIASLFPNLFAIASRSAQGKLSLSYENYIYTGAGPDPDLCPLQQQAKGVQISLVLTSCQCLVSVVSDISHIYIST